MQFIVYATENSPAAAAPPSMEQLAALGALTEEGRKSGILVTTGAAQPTSKRLRMTDGKFTVTDGPFIEAKELIAGFAVLEVKSVDEAIEFAKRFRNIVGDGESEIVRIFGPNDFGRQ